MGSRLQASRFATIADWQEEDKMSSSQELLEGLGKFVQLEEKEVKKSEIRLGDRGKAKLKVSNSQKHMYAIKGKENVQPYGDVGLQVSGPSRHEPSRREQKPIATTEKKARVSKGQRIHCVVSRSMDRMEPMTISMRKQPIEVC